MEHLKLPLPVLIPSNKRKLRVLGKECPSLVSPICQNLETRPHMAAKGDENVAFQGVHGLLAEGLFLRRGGLMFRWAV